MKDLLPRQHMLRSRSPELSAGWRRGLGGAASRFAVVALTLGLAACGGAGEVRKPGVPHLSNGGEGGAHPGVVGGQGGSGATEGVATGCEPGEQEDCTVYVPQASGVTSCWKGVRLCVDGEFSECLDPGSIAASTGG